MLGHIRLAGLVLWLAGAGAVYSDPITIGYLSFDAGTPAGLNSFSLANRTGASLGCDFSFPSCTELAISGTLTIDFDGAPSESRTLLAPLGAGFYTPTIFEFDPSLLPLSASFSGTVTPVNLELIGGLPAHTNGSVTGTVDLTMDTFMLLMVDADANTTTTPEPVSTALVLLGLICLLGRKTSLSCRSLRF